MTDEDKFKQKYMEFQILEQHIKEVQQQLQILNQKSQELKELDENLSDLGKMKEEEMLSQIGSGVYVKAKLKDTKNIILNVGANTAIETTLAEARKIIQEQIKKIDESITQIEEKLSQAAMHAQHIQQELISAQSEK